MELLSRDIKSIVHRYIIDYYYCRVKAEYKREWLSDWNDREQCFVDDNDNYVANWRVGHSGCGIYMFGADERVAVLSKNYY